VAKYTSQVKARTGDTTNVFISQRERRRGFYMYRWYFTHHIYRYEYGWGDEPVSVRFARLWHLLEEPALTQRPWHVSYFASSNPSDAARAFDPDSSDGWYSEFDYDSDTSKHYLGIQFDRRVLVHHYDLAPDEFSREPTSWVLQGSNDGVGWTGIHIVTAFDWEPFFDGSTEHDDFVRFDVDHIRRSV